MDCLFSIISIIFNNMDISLKTKFERILLEENKPSSFFEDVKNCPPFYESFPELFALIGVKQNPKYHAEGDVWTHTMLVLDAAASFRHLVSNPLGFMLSALVHDVGKAVCTEEINGVVHSYEHETLGLPLVEKFLRRFSYPDTTITYVLNMVRLHMKPNKIAVNKSSLKASNHMFCEAAAPLDLIYLGAADAMGQIPTGDVWANIEFLKERLSAYNKIISRPFVTKEQFISAGYTDGHILEETMAYSVKLQLAGIEKDSALKQCLSHAACLKRKMEKSLH